MLGNFLKRFLRFLADRSSLFAAALMLGLLGLLIWYLVSQQEELSNSIAVVATFFAALSAFFSLLQVTETRKQRELSERPYIHAYFDDEYSGMLVFKITNSGNSPAHNVEVAFKPTPKDYANRNLSKISIFAKPITFIPPGKTHRQLIIQGFVFFKKNRRKRYSVTLTYYSSSGERFRETTIHDLSFLKEAHLPPKQVEDYLKEIAEEQKKIARELYQVRNNLSRD